MSDQPKYQTVDENALIDVQVPGAMFIRLNQLLMAGLGIKDHQELQEITARVRAKAPDKQSSKDYHAETVMLMNMLISDAAKKQGKMVDFNINTIIPNKG